MSVVDNFLKKISKRFHKSSTRQKILGIKYYLSLLKITKKPDLVKVLLHKLKLNKIYVDTQNYKRYSEIHFIIFALTLR